MLNNLKNKICPRCLTEFQTLDARVKNCEECRLKNNERKNKERRTTERRENCVKCNAQLGSTCNAKTLYCGPCKLKNKREDSAKRRQNPLYRAKEANYYDTSRSTYDYKIANDPNFKKSEFLDRYYAKKDLSEESEDDDEPEEQPTYIPLAVEQEIDFVNGLVEMFL